MVKKKKSRKNQIKKRFMIYGGITLTIIIFILVLVIIKYGGESEKSICELREGRWGRIGLDLEPSCNLPTSDGGKLCTDSNECESWCVGEDETSITGKCADFKIVVGCNAILENGKATILCID